MGSDHEQCKLLSETCEASGPVLVYWVPWTKADKTG